MLCLLSPREGLFKVLHVERPGGSFGAWLPKETLPTDMQEGVNMGEDLAQKIEHFAEIGMRLLLGRVGPEQKSEMRAGLRCCSVQQEVGQQGLQTRHLDGRNIGLGSLQPELTEQTDAEREDGG